MENKKTILYLITQSELGGAQRYVFDLAKNLKNEYNIIVGLGEQGDKGEIAQRLDKENIKYYRIPHLQRNISPANDISALINIYKLIDKIKPDIIHLNSSKISILGSIAGYANQLMGKKLRIIYTAHGWVFNEPMSGIKKIFYKYAEKFTATFKDKIICVSEYDRQTALKEKIVAEKKLVTVHNGIEKIDFLPREQAREKISQISNILIGCIANFYPTKGLKYLIEATKILITSYQLPVTLIIIGEGEQRIYLEGLIYKYSLDKNIILAGRVNNAPELLSAFDLYVCSSVKEGLSYTLIEAMQAGLPIVATNVGGNGELIIDNQTGLLAEAKNPEDLAEKIKKLIDSRELQQSLGATAREKALNEFNLKKIINKTKEIYNNI